MHTHLGGGILEQQKTLPAGSSLGWGNPFTQRWGGFWMLPEDIRAMLEYITPLRKDKAPFDMPLINSRYVKLKGKLIGAE